MGREEKWPVCRLSTEETPLHQAEGEGLARGPERAPLSPDGWGRARRQRKGLSLRLCLGRGSGCGCLGMSCVHVRVKEKRAGKQNRTRKSWLAPTAHFPRLGHCARRSVSTFSVNPYAHGRHCYHHPRSTEEDTESHTASKRWTKHGITAMRHRGPGLRRLSPAPCMSSRPHPKAAQGSWGRRHLGWGHGEESGDIRVINSYGPGRVKLLVSSLCPGLRRLLWNPKFPIFYGPPSTHSAGRTPASRL